jgi:hypothetical protein
MVNWRKACTISSLPTSVACPIVQFAVNDLVFIKLQPCIQTSVAPRANHKLLFKFYGPFRVIKYISEVAYELELPQGTTVHPVFQVSKLRQALTSGTTASSTLPAMSNVISFPVKVLVTRWRKKANRMVKQTLIQWSIGDTMSSTWEDREEPCSHFLAAAARGQVVIQGGRDVRVLSMMPRQNKTRKKREEKVQSRPTTLSRRGLVVRPNPTRSTWARSGPSKRHYKRASM